MQIPDLLRATTVGLFYSAGLETAEYALEFRKKLNQVYELKKVHVHREKLAQLLLLLTAESGMQLRVWGEDWRPLFPVRQKVITSRSLHENGC